MPCGRSKFTRWIICSSLWTIGVFPQPSIGPESLSIQDRRHKWPSASWKMLGRESEKYVSRFVVRTGSRIQIVLADDTEWIGAAGDYTELHVHGRSHLLRETMSFLEQKLDPARFLRIHRSRIVRTGCILELRSIDNREYLVKLSDGSEHRSSRSYARRLEEWLDSARAE
jgi:two-component system LytT family response regulator